MKFNWIFIGLLVAADAASAESWRFAACGDTRGDPVNEVVLSDIVSAMTNDGVEAILVSGDLVLSGDETSFRVWTNVMGPAYESGIKVYPVRGNHDSGTGWTNVFGGDIPDNGPPGQVDYTFWATNRNALFVGFDQLILFMQADLNWFGGVLQSNRLPHVFVMGHYPAFKVYHPDCMDDYPTNRNGMWSAMTNSKSMVYFTGHDHFFDHMRLDDGDGNAKNDAHQYVAGNGGAPPYNDAPYDGDNGSWSPVRVLHDQQYGYVLVEIDDYDVTLTYRRRASPGVFTAMDVFSYNVHQATDPTPTNGETGVAVTTPITWSGAPQAVSHIIYLGTNQSAVASATTGSPEFLANTVLMSLAVPGRTYSTEYFWRVDEAYAGGSVITGKVWSHVIQGPEPVISNDGGASGILETSAVLNGYLASTGAGPTFVTVFWGTNDAGTVTNAWQLTNRLGECTVGSLSTNVTLPGNSGLYFYRFHATNLAGAAWAASSASFVVDGPLVTNIAPEPGSMIGWKHSRIEVSFSKPVFGVDTTDLVLSGPGASHAEVGLVTNTGGNTWAFDVYGLTNGVLDLTLAPDPDDIESGTGVDISPRPVIWSNTVLLRGVDIPFYDGFEEGTVSNSFDIYSSRALGRIFPTTLYAPVEGNYHVVMDRSTTGPTNVNELILAADLTGHSNVVLSFLHKSINDDPDPMPQSFTGHTNGDGVAISADGTNWLTVVSLSTAPLSYLHYSVDLDAGAWAGGLTYGPLFRIKFQQTDNDTLVQDGCAWDDIELYESVPSTRYVSTNGTEVFPYTNWTTAARGLQTAVDHAFSGDTVLVDRGTYTLATQVSINKGVTVRSEYGPAETIVSGNDAVRCFRINASRALLDGFTARNGLADEGAGVWVHGRSSVRNCIITSNSTTSAYGGGISMYYGADVRNCLIALNSSIQSGGGVAMSFGGYLENCVVYSNQSVNGGGGIDAWDSGAISNVIANCVVTRNRGGAGMYFFSTGIGHELRNSIVYFNAPGDYFSDTAGAGLLENNCIGGIPASNGNIDADPLFVDMAGDYHLQSGSPCIDSGTNLPAVARDFDGISRPLDGNADGTPRWDMGAYEFANALADTDNDRMRDSDEVTARTDPVDPASRLEIKREYRHPTNTAFTVLQWTSASNVRYGVATSTNMLGWLPVTDPDYTNVTGTGSLIDYTNTDSVSPARFFRVNIVTN